MNKLESVNQRNNLTTMQKVILSAADNCKEFVFILRTLAKVLKTDGHQISITLQDKFKIQFYTSGTKDGLMITVSKIISGKKGDTICTFFHIPRDINPIVIDGNKEDFIRAINLLIEEVKKNELKFNSFSEEEVRQAYQKISGDFNRVMQGFAGLFKK